MSEKTNSSKKAMVILLVIAMLASLGFSFLSTKPQFYKHTIDYLDGKKMDALAISASATAVAVGVSAIPGDVTEPIAEMLTNIATYSVLLTCVIFLEKLLLTTFGAATFGVIFPAACMLLIIYILNRKDALKIFAYKLLVLGLVVFLAVPSGALVSWILETTNSETYETVMTEVETVEKDGSTWEKLKGSVSDISTHLKKELNKFVDALAIMIITTCVVPLSVVALLLWIIKALFNINIGASKIKSVTIGANKIRKSIKETAYSASE